LREATRRTVFMLAEDFHGKSVGPHVGDFQGVDNIDAGRTNFQLSEFWWEGSFLDGDVGVRIGKQDANAELGVFFQYGWSPEERNEIAQFYGAGLVYKGLIDSRDDDILGFGIASANFSDRMAVPADKTAFELFYKIPLSPYFTIQPDMQVITNPSGVEADSFVVGLRFEAVL